MDFSDSGATILSRGLAGWQDSWLAGFMSPWWARGWAPGRCRRHLQTDGVQGWAGELEEPAGPICELFADLGLQGE